MSKFKNFNDAATVAELKLVSTVYACETVRDVLYCNRNYGSINALLMYNIDIMILTYHILVGKIQS